MSLRKLSIICLLALTVFHFGFLGGSKKNAVATIDKEVITVDDLNERLKAFPQQFQTALQQKENKVKVLDQLIDEALLLTEAKKKGYTKNSDYKDRMDQAKKQILISLVIRDNIDKKITLTQEDLTNYYTRNKDAYAEKEQRRVSHILVKEEAQAKKLLAQLKKGKGAFDKVAKKHSIDPTKDNGGDIGWFQKGQLVPEFEKAAYGIKKKGSLSGVVKTQFGFHIIKLTDKRVRPEIKFDDVKAQIQQNVYAEKKRALTDQFLAQLKKDHKVTRDIAKID